jgi:hypothetical protein
MLFFQEKSAHVGCEVRSVRRFEQTTLRPTDAMSPRERARNGQQAFVLVALLASVHVGVGVVDTNEQQKAAMNAEPRIVRTAIASQ